MEILYYLSATFLIIFMLLATYDGLYLHIWKYELFKRKESIFEHKTHAIRAILFPLIVWLLFVKTNTTYFYFALLFITVDLIVLGVDAFSEKDSRKSIGGLPRWEYILHLFANSFHFASIALIVATKIEISASNIRLIESINPSFGQELIEIISVNIIPGAILLALVHLLLLFPKGIIIWGKLKSRITPYK